MVPFPPHLGNLSCRAESPEQVEAHLGHLEVLGGVGHQGLLDVPHHLPRYKKRRQQLGGIYLF